ncbi:MAG: preprotein translocase subunit SecG, partial [Candidatus Omnitrophica bacterium]|nr:preprotein translocase subunit SecG [Candidatus Omnitrophota bacterium]
GAKTNEFMIRTTAVLGVIFLTTSVSLAYFSSKKEVSLMRNVKVEQTSTEAKVQDVAPVSEEPVAPSDQGASLPESETSAPVVKEEVVPAPAAENN